MKKRIKEHPLVSLVVFILVIIFFIGPGFGLVKAAAILVASLIFGLFFLLAVVFCIAYLMHVFLGIKMRWFFELFEALQVERMIHRMPKEKKQTRE